MDILFLILGLALILAGANMLTDGASAIAKRRGIPDIVIGLTVVAFGTSAPEFVISLLSAIEGSTELAIGNAVGSNIFNVLAIIGITAFVRPVSIERGILTSDIPLVIVSALALLAMGSGPWLGDTAGARVLGRSDGIVLLLFFAIFMRYTFAQASAPAAQADEAAAASAAMRPMSGWKSALWVVLGLAGLIGGGSLFVDGASGIASALGVSEAVIGLTIVAAGTSLPELATSVVSALKGKPGIAVGNVIGSNIFNIFFVLGSAATVRPLSFGSIGEPDLLVLVGACCLFWLFGWFFKARIITRLEGAVLAACYVAYTAWLVASA